MSSKVSCNKVDVAEEVRVMEAAAVMAGIVNDDDEH